MAKRKRERAKRGGGSVTWDKARQRWRARANDEHGKPRSAYFPADQESLAWEWVRRLQAARVQLLAGEIPATAPLAQHLDTWTAGICANLRPASQYRYRYDRTRVLSALPPGIALVDVGYLHIERMDRILRNDYAQSTCDHTLSYLTRFFTAMVDRELVTRNPVAVYLRNTSPQGRGGTAKRQPPRLTVDDCRAILRAVAGHRNAPIYAVALTLGLRIGELIGLQWSDIDLKAGTLHIRRQRSRASGALVEGEPKTAPGVRLLPLPPALVSVFAAHAARQLQELNALPAAPALSAVFRAEHGGYAAEQTIRKQLGRIAPGVAPHDLRRAAASHMLSLGGETRIVGAILGHGPKNMTELYATPSLEAKRRAVDAWAAVLFGAGEKSAEIAS
jgi:integrase